MFGVGADGGPVVPAALTLFVRTLLGGDGRRLGAGFELDLADDAQGGEVVCSEIVYYRC